MLLTISHLPPTIKRRLSVNTLCGGSVNYTALNSSALLPNLVLRGQSCQYVLVYNFTNMHAMSYLSDFSGSGCRVNSSKPAVCCTVSLLSAVLQVRWPSFPIATVMSDSKSLNTSLRKVIISSKNEHVFIHDLSDLTLQILFDGSRASMNVGSKRSIAWNNSKQPSSWQFSLHCGIEETGNPGIICIVCDQVLRHPSQHGTSSMGRNLLAKAHIAMWNESTEPDVSQLTSSTVNETALAILKRPGS